jgi:hypothetical protein
MIDLPDIVNPCNPSPVTKINVMANIKIQKKGAKDGFYAGAPVLF